MSITVSLRVLCLFLRVLARMDDAIDSLRRYSGYQIRPGRSEVRESKMPFGRSI